MLHAICLQLEGKYSNYSLVLLLLLLLLSRFSRVRLYATPKTAVHQATPSLGFSRQEHWSGLPLPSPALLLGLLLILVMEMKTYSCVGSDLNLLGEPRKGT